jgi:hypothetical protein
MSQPPEPLFTAKELAALLKRSRTYVFAMKRRGFVMVGGRATLTEARSWLKIHPLPRAKDSRD